MSTELWRECAAWLDQLGLVPAGDALKASPKSATLTDLVSLLRDGAVLCRLADALDPGSVDLERVLTDPPDPESSRSVSDFLCRHNIFLFLHAAVASFHLDTEEHFFQPEELYQCKDLGRVLRTLSALSHSAKARARSGLPGFPKKEKLLGKKLKQEQKNYEALNRIYGEAETEYLYDSFSRPARELDESHYEDIYQTIFPPRHSRLPLDISFGLGAAGKRSKRAAPMQELLETEDKYLENLIMVRDVFRDALTAMAPPVKSAVFYRLDGLIDLHSDLLFGLKQKRTDVGAVFLAHMVRVAALYGEYCVNLPVAMDALERAQADNAVLRKQIFDCQTRAKPATFPLSSHLVIPFQRFLKYHLLLKEILKNTPSDYPDHDNISKACDEMLRIGMEVNERKRECEDADRQLQADAADVRLIENVAQSIKLMQLPGEHRLADFGRLRKAGDVTVYTDRGKAADYAFLFDMVLVLCHKPRWLQHRYRFREAARVKDYFLEPIPPAPPEMEAPDPSVFSLRLFRRSDSRRPPLTLITKTFAERESWFQAILTAMDNVSPSENANQGHVLQMTTFVGEKAAECFQCGKTLKGSFFQGYRCLRCQVNLHKACIGDCPCIEIASAAGGGTGGGPGAGVKRVESMALPTALPDTMERSNSTLSLAAPGGNGNGGKLSQHVQELQRTLQREQEETPLEQQPWFAGELAGRVACDRLEALPVGTFLVRQRANGQFALMLKTPEQPKGVKAMAIVREGGGDVAHVSYCFSGARKFESVQKLVTFYRDKDLTENFDYPALKGVPLKHPYKNL